MVCRVSPIVTGSPATAASMRGVILMSAGSQLPSGSTITAGS